MSRLFLSRNTEGRNGAPRAMATARGALFALGDTVEALYGKAPETRKTLSLWRRLVERARVVPELMVPGVRKACTERAQSVRPACTVWRELSAGTHTRTRTQLAEAGCVRAAAAREMAGHMVTVGKQFRRPKVPYLLPPRPAPRRPACRTSCLLPSRQADTGAGGDNGIVHDKNWLRFPYVFMFSRSHDLHPHPYHRELADPRGGAAPLSSVGARRLGAVVRGLVRGWATGR
jgi:hypothetical protein